MSSVWECFELLRPEGKMILARSVADRDAHQKDTHTHTHTHTICDPWPDNNLHKTSQRYISLQGSSFEGNAPPPLPPPAFTSHCTAP